VRLNEGYYSDLAKFFGRTPGAPVQYYLYRTKDEKVALTGDSANAHNDFATRSVHAVYSESIRAVGYHELAHLFAQAAWGKTGTRLMGEGLAVWFDGAWWRKPLSYWGGRLWRERKVPALAAIADGGGRYWETQEDMGYALAGDFFGFLSRRFTRAQVRALYGEPLTDANVRRDLGLSLPALQAAWYSDLREQAAGAKDARKPL
ncbi:MAG: hypothetical protein KGL53_01280, partial [Elusimicrobia bacterium]|nr:hypothetical protein [Elusimicrobiota bacterium]